MKKTVLFLAAGALTFAGSTRTWVQSEASDFEKGHLQGLSMRSDGRLSVAPKAAELFDASTAYLWALAADSKGNLYAGGGPGAKLFQIAPDGSHKKLAEFDALEIHAIAVDAKDQVYAATSPDGKVYRVSAAGKSDEFYDPKEKYIWAMTFGANGDLFVATGDNGRIHRVDRNGKGSVFFKTGETHSRSVAVDAAGNLLVGTDPGGLVIRVSPAGAGFVLYQMAKREVTAIATAPDGSIYAAAAAGGGAVASLPALAALSLGVSKPGTEPAPVPAARPVAPGGADLYRIDKNGVPEKMWSSAHDTVYAIAFDAQGRAILGTGNNGNLYRVESPESSTTLLSVTSTQITNAIARPDGAIYAAASNVGKVFKFGPELEKEGSVESDVLDAGGFSQWGRLKAEAQGKVQLFARSGNLDQPRENWSGWAAVTERVISPAARFLQWKAVLQSGATLDSVEAAYLPRNVAPRVEEVESTPPNYKFAAPATGIGSAGPAATITLPAMGKHAAGGAGASLDLGITSMTLAKGWIGARWNATDDNGDALIYTVEIRGEKESAWRPLAEKLHEKHYSFDSTAFPDGEYRVRVTASDAPGNVPAETLTGAQVSAPFTIDNTPPEVTGLAVTGRRARWKAGDALSVIKRAEYSIDGGEWTMVNPVTQLSDSLTLEYDLALPAWGPGEHVLAVRVTDDYENQGVAKVVAGR